MHDATDRDGHDDTTRMDEGDDRGARAMSGEAIDRAAAENLDEPRRRFRRRTDRGEAMAGESESLDAVRAELLLEGLLIRESLLEICQEVERSMVAFEGKLNALVAVVKVDPGIDQDDGYRSGVV
jgi:hypothetical protein